MMNADNTERRAKHRNNAPASITFTHRRKDTEMGEKCRHSNLTFWRKRPGTKMSDGVAQRRTKACSLFWQSFQGFAIHQLEAGNRWFSPNL